MEPFLQKNTIRMLVRNSSVQEMKPSQKKGAPEAINVLKVLDKADEVILKDVPKEDVEMTPILLRNQYEWLSEFCHPNYHSSALSHELAVGRPIARFWYDEPMRGRDCSLLHNILFSGAIFNEYASNSAELIEQI